MSNQHSRLLPLPSLTFQEALTDVLKIKPEPKPPKAQKSTKPARKATPRVRKK